MMSKEEKKDFIFDAVMYLGGFHTKKNLKYICCSNVYLLNETEEITIDSDGYGNLDVYYGTWNVSKQVWEDKLYEELPQSVVNKIIKKLLTKLHSLEEEIKDLTDSIN